MPCRPHNPHACRESQGQGSSGNLCLWGLVHGTFRSPQVCSHTAESHGQGLLGSEQETWAPGLADSLARRALSSSAG